VKTLSSDTDASAENVLIQLFRQASVYRRLEIVDSLVKTTRRLSWQAICARHPEETPQALTRRFLSLLYPDFTRSKELEKILLRENDEKR
jgi:MoxR-like ATPase